MTNPFSRLGYAALKLESVVGTAVKPDTYFELLAEDVLGEYGRQAVTGITGKRDAKLRSVNDKISVSGMITVLVEPNTIGYLFRALLGTPSTMTLQAGKVYRHVFTPSTTLQTYTIDLKKAGENYVRRIIGAYIEQAEFSQTDNKIQVVLTVRALGIFDHARLTTNEASNSTVYGVDQTKGITTGDILLVRSSGDQDTDLMTHSVASVDNETQVTVDAKAVAATESDLVLIKASTPLYTLSDNLTWIGGSKYGVRAEDDIYNAIDNIETSDAEDYSLIIMNTLEERHTARGSNLADRFPARIFAKDFLVEGSFTHYYSSPEFIDDMRSKGKGCDTRAPLRSAN
jgi:hypothetical protein